MSCSSCRCERFVNGNDGSFVAGTRAVRYRDGSETFERVIRYTAYADVFGTEVELEDHFTINFCPMCGRDLNGGEE